MQDAILVFAILIASIVIHENAHGWVALSLGDPTAKMMGRLTLNPIKHLDLVGSIIIPAMIALSTCVAGACTTFGYAKPVPINPRNLRGTDRFGFAVVALAGPVSNVVIGFAAITVLEIMNPTSLTFTARILALTFNVNIFLAAFNLVPIPPLDGSRLLRPFLTQKGRSTLDRIEPFGFLIILVLLVWLNDPFFRVIDLIRRAILTVLPL